MEVHDGQRQFLKTRLKHSPFYGMCPQRLCKAFEEEFTKQYSCLIKTFIKRENHQSPTHVLSSLLLSCLFLILWEQILGGGAAACPLCCSQALLSKGKITGWLFLVFCKVGNSISALKPVVMVCVILGMLAEVCSV